MFFKNKASADDLTESLQHVDVRYKSIAVIDVTDVTALPDGSEVSDVIGTPMEEAMAGAARVEAGLFLSEKPTVRESVKAPSIGLRDRFSRKAAASSSTATRDDAVQSADKPAHVIDGALPTGSSAPTKPKWSFSKSKRTPAITEPGPAPAEQGPVGPTVKFKKPIIVSKVSEKRKLRALALPIRVLIGFLPDVTERDARDYALGIAERNCDQISLVYYDAFKLNSGFAYEIHEGGNGRAFLPEIIAHFESQGTFAKGGMAAHVFVQTATRVVQVDRTRDGLQALLLPESSTQVGSEFLEGTTKMTQALQTMTGFLVLGATLFTTGFLALSLALISRIQPYDAPLAPTIERATDAYNLSPASRWAMLQSVQGTEYVKALRFARGKWELERGIAPSEEASQTPAPMPGGGPSAMPGAGLPMVPAPMAPVMPVLPGASKP